MRAAYLTAATVVLVLCACGGPTGPTGDVRTPETRLETPEADIPSPTSPPLVQKKAGNTLIRAPEYTGVIFSEDGASKFGPVLGSSYAGFWEPSIDDVSRAEDSIRQFLVSMQNDPKTGDYQQENLRFIISNLDKYGRQYVGVVVDGEKRIWCNMFRSDNPYPNWELAPVMVLDGGKDYWQIEYDLLKDECINFYVHGES